MAMVVSGKEAGKGQQAAAAGMDAGKYVRYTPEQVEALERVYTECPKPSSLRRKQLIRECPILSNIEPKQIKVWFQNRRNFANAALRHLKQIAQETSGEVPYGSGRRPAVLRTFINKCNSFPPAYVIQNVPPAILVQFLREHRSEWADCGVDAYSAASLTANPYAVPAVRPSGGFLGSQVILPLAHTVEHEEDSPAATRTLDLASTLEIGSGVTARAVNETASSTYNLRSVLTIAFQFTYENHLRDSVAEMARQYVRSVVASVQRVAMAIAPSRPGSQIGVKHPPGSPEAHTLARWISGSYSDLLLKLLWHHSDAIMCCSLKASPVLTFSNQAGLDMLETTLIALQDIALEKILDDSARKVLCSEFPKIMQQVSK
ncbi:hypothetical protein GW17_00044816 [Ensete ventricosum]|nr:hypothetical protein GW17_00044816 [Ensete ventricosum]